MAEPWEKEKTVKQQKDKRSRRRTGKSQTRVEELCIQK